MPRHGEGVGVGGYPHFVVYIWPVFGRGGQATVVAGAVNRVYYTPIIVTVPTTIDRLGCYHGAPAVGNFYMALYDSVAEAPVNRLAVSANTPCAGPGQKEQVPIVPLTLDLDPGYYFIALTWDDVLDQFGELQAATLMIAPPNVLHGPTCYHERPAFYGPPPLVATPVWGMAWGREYFMWARGFLTP